jgi:hypothetical protein
MSPPWIGRRAFVRRRRARYVVVIVGDRVSDAVSLSGLGCAAGLVWWGGHRAGRW